MTRTEPFGTTRAGTTVEAVTLRGGALQARVITYGAILQAVHLEGLSHSLTPGPARMADCEGPIPYHGAIVGPVANRLSGARAEIGGRAYRFEANEAGRTTLHSGSTGTHAQVWRIADAGAAHVLMALDLPDGMGGFPGNRRMTARFDLRPPATLRLTLEATTDAPTLMNLANHSYWNLEGTATWAGHTLRIAADRWLPTRPDGTPPGHILPVGGTPMDFRRTRRLIPGAPPLDHCFCLGDTSAPRREVAWLTGAGGTSMALATTAPGLQVYDGRAAIRPGGVAHEGLAFEPQFWPDAPANPAFPSIELQPEAAWCQITEWRFSQNP